MLRECFFHKYRWSLRWLKEVVAKSGSDGAYSHKLCQMDSLQWKQHRRPPALVKRKLFHTERSESWLKEWLQKVAPREPIVKNCAKWIVCSEKRIGDRLG